MVVVVLLDGWIIFNPGFIHFFLTLCCLLLDSTRRERLTAMKPAVVPVAIRAISIG